MFFLSNGNRFLRLPSVLYELKQIQEILVNDNQLVELDAAGILKISSTLITFNVRNNNIQRLPPELSKCPLLKSLDVAGCSTSLFRRFLRIRFSSFRKPVQTAATSNCCQRNERHSRILEESTSRMTTKSRTCFFLFFFLRAVRSHFDISFLRARQRH